MLDRLPKLSEAAFGMYHKDNEDQTIAVLIDSYVQKTVCKIFIISRQVCNFLALMIFPWTLSALLFTGEDGP